MKINIDFYNYKTKKTNQLTKTEQNYLIVFKEEK